MEWSIFSWKGPTKVISSIFLSTSGLTKSGQAGAGERMLGLRSGGGRLVPPSRQHGRGCFSLCPDRLAHCQARDHLQDGARRDAVHASPSQGTVEAPDPCSRQVPGGCRGGRGFQQHRPVGPRFSVH